MIFLINSILVTSMRSLKNRIKGFEKRVAELFKDYSQQEHYNTQAKLYSTFMKASKYSMVSAKETLENFELIFGRPPMYEVRPTLNGEAFDLYRLNEKGEFMPNETKMKKD